jgi:hypothetical protein
MLGSRSEADDAEQETWLRLSGAEAKDVENPGGWRIVHPALVNGAAGVVIASTGSPSRSWDSPS